MNHVTSHMTLRRFNNYLAFCTIAVCLYTVLLPILPLINFWLQNSVAHFKPPTTSNSLIANISKDNSDIDTLTIPKLFVKTIINEGNSTAALDHGVWHRPGTGDPVNGGNMVIAGHRFIYGANSAFYNLDRLKTGDLLGIHWHGHQYVYQVTSTEVVDPTDVAIEAPTKDAELTLFTCTPLWTSLERQVIHAKLIQKGQ